MKRALLQTLAACLFAFFAPSSAGARAIDLLNFDSASGDAPGAGVVVDAHGNIFGTTTSGGNGPCDGGAGCGTVYELSPQGKGSWNLTVLYNFQGGQDGYFADMPLAIDHAGNLYGYTIGGSYGTVFELSPPGGSGSWTFSILYRFTNGKDGNLSFVYSALLPHGKSLYGIASGGADCGQQGLGCGSVFRLTPPKSGTGSWHLKTLYAFTGGSTSGIPDSIVGPDSNGEFYVSTLDGTGAVVQLVPARGAWTENVLTNFKGGKDGFGPGSLVLAPGDIVYGIAGADKAGLAFSLSNSGSGWTRTNIAQIAHNFYGPTSLATGPNGSLVGVIEGDFDFFAGNVFQLTESNGAWSYAQLWSFNRGPDRNPLNVVTGPKGRLFGVLNGGDSTNGSLFELR